MALRMPPSPSATARTTSSLASDVTTTSRPETASAIECASQPPAATTFPARPAVPDDDVMAAAQQPPGDGLSHATHSEHGDVHDVSYCPAGAGSNPTVVWRSWSSRSWGTGSGAGCSPAVARGSATPGWWPTTTG